MDTTIITQFDDTPVLTSAIYAVRARTTKEKVAVEVVRDPAGVADSFFSTTLYAHAGIVELTDVGTLIEERLRLKDRVWDMVEVRFDGVAAEFTAVYCEWVLARGFDCTKCFLSASSESVVHPNSAISLTHWDDGTNVYEVKVVGLDAGGNTAVACFPFSKLPTANVVSFAVNEIIDYALNTADDNTGVELASVAYFAIAHGAMRKVFYIGRHPFFLTFLFRNMFNAPEYVDVPGIVTCKTKYDRDSAFCSGRALQYNQSVERTYEMATGPLTAAQVRELEQLVGSRDIRLCAADQDYEVIITDHTVEVDNDNESLSTVKFTFRFTSSRPVLTVGDMGSLMPSASRVFSQEFTAEFA